MEPAGRLGAGPAAAHDDMQRSALGFSIEDCRLLLGLYEDDSRASADVKQLAQAHLSKIEEKINDLEAMRATLSELITCCSGDNRPDCPILKDLSGECEDAG